MSNNCSDICKEHVDIAMLKLNELIRKQWQFPVNSKETNNENQQMKIATSMFLLFTLKTPLEQNNVQNLGSKISFEDLQVVIRGKYIFFIFFLTTSTFIIDSNVGKDLFL